MYNFFPPYSSSREDRPPISRRTRERATTWKASSPLFGGENGVWRSRKNLFPVISAGADLSHFINGWYHLASEEVRKSFTEELQNSFSQRLWTFVRVTMPLLAENAVAIDRWAFERRHSAILHSDPSRGNPFPRPPTSVNQLLFLLSFFHPVCPYILVLSLWLVSFDFSSCTAGQL